MKIELPPKIVSLLRDPAVLILLGITELAYAAVNVFVLAGPVIALAGETIGHGMVVFSTVLLVVSGVGTATIGVLSIVRRKR